MMYLGIFVFVVLTTSGLVQSNKVSPAQFVCPKCYAEGEDSYSDCEDIMENKACSEKDPVCAMTVGTLYDDQYTDRDCISRKMYQETVADCDHYQDCKIVMCETSGCKAEFPDVPVTPTSFMCPVCSAEGETSDSDCEDQIVNKPCSVRNPVCSLTINTQASYHKFTFRKCQSKALYQDSKDECEYYGDCKMVMCETSGCKAEFPRGI